MPASVAAPPWPLELESEGEGAVTLVVYDERRLEERRPAGLEEAFPLPEPPLIAWLDVKGLDPGLLGPLGERLGLHPLVIEDLLTPGQRPKLEDYGDYLFLILYAFRHGIGQGGGERGGRGGELWGEQIALLWGSNWAASVEERGDGLFEPVRRRLRNEKARLRRRKVDYLAYALIDAVVDRYFVVLEQLSDRIEVLSEEVATAPTPKTLQAIHRVKRELLFLRKSLWPLREALGKLLRTDSPWISRETRPFLHDVYDHTVHALDVVETLRDLVTGMLDVYLSSAGNRLNEIMKALTVIATIFMPLTVLAGIYGMNFDYMPELHWRWGYFVVLGIMAVLTGGLLIYFRRKRWL